jgi:hypothetical protein
MEEDAPFRRGPWSLAAAAAAAACASACAFASACFTTAAATAIKAGITAASATLAADSGAADVQVGHGGIANKVDLKAHTCVLLMADHVEHSTTVAYQQQLKSINTLC